MFSRFSKGLVAIIIVAIIMGVVDMPDSIKATWPDNGFVNLFKKPKVTLGLDLQGGTQLDYRIDLRNAMAKNADSDSSNDVKISDITEGVRNTIERRVNGLGVSEPQIYLSNVADEQHIVVELAGIKDVEEAKAVVGKTIQLEFKEKKTEMEADEKSKVQSAAKAVLDQAMVKGSDFTKIGQGADTTDKKTQFRPNVSTFVSQLPTHYKDILTKMKNGQAYDKVIEGSDGYTITQDNQISEIKGLYIVQLINSEIKDKTDKKYATIDDVAKEMSVTAESLNGKKLSDFDKAKLFLPIKNIPMSLKTAVTFWSTAL